MAKDNYAKILQSTRMNPTVEKQLPNISSKLGHVTGAKKASKKTILELYRDGKGISVESAINAGAQPKDHESAWASYKRINQGDKWVTEFAKACAKRGDGIKFNLKPFLTIKK